MFYKTLAPGCIGHGEILFTDVAEMTKRYGFEGYWFDAARDFESDPFRTRALLDQYSLKPAGFALPVNYREDEAVYLTDCEKLDAYIDFSKKIGIKRCITWVIPAHDRLTYAENFELHRRRLTPIAKKLADAGILFGLEFLGPQKLRQGANFEFIHTLDGMLELCQAIGTDNCGILIDAWHWDMAGQKFEDYGKFDSPDKIVCAHIMDAPEGVPSCEQEDLVRRLPGTTGIIHIEEFFAGLQKVGYEGPVLVEPFENFLSQIGFEEAVRIVKKSMDRVWP